MGCQLLSQGGGGWCVTGGGGRRVPRALVLTGKYSFMPCYPSPATHHPGNALPVDRLNQPFFCHDAGYELGRGHIEGRIVRLDSVGSGLLAEAMGDFARIALLDGNSRAVRQSHVERVRWGSDIEGKPVGPGQE